MEPIYPHPVSTWIWCCFTGPLQTLVGKSVHYHRNPPRQPKCWVIHKPGVFIGDFYDICEIVGKGSFGTVRKVKSLHGGRECVMKLVTRKQVSHEIALHAALDHPHVVRIFETFSDTRFSQIVVELCRGGELLGALCRTRPSSSGPAMSESEARHIYKQIICALLYLHTEHVAHRDVKLENCLLQDTNREIADWTVKLIDFGFASRFAPDYPSMRTKCGSTGYLAPEILERPVYNEKCDVFSAGVLLYTLLSGDMPFQGRTPSSVDSCLKWSPLPKMDYRPSCEAWHLVENTCQKVPERRFDVRQVVDWPWLKKDPPRGGAKLRPCFSIPIDREMKERLCVFAQKHIFYRLALYRVAYYLDDAHVRRFCSDFEVLDANGDGKISKEEFRTALEGHNFDGSGVCCVDSLFECLDTDSNGTIDFTEFVAAIVESGEISEQACYAAFRSFDAEGVGRISTNLVREELGWRNTGINNKHVQQIFDEVGTDDTGEISAEKFAAMLGFDQIRWSRCGA